MAAAQADSQAYGIEKVSLDEVLRADTSLLTGGRELGPLARVGYKLALFILAFLSLVTAVLLYDYLRNSPSLPTGAPLDQAQLTLYQQFSQASLDRTLKLLDAIVLKGFLPVFTAVLGYIFGTREGH